MREAPSIVISKQLIAKGAVAFELVAIENAKKILPQDVVYTEFIEGCAGKYRYGIYSYGMDSN